MTTQREELHAAANASAARNKRKWQGELDEDKAEPQPMPEIDEALVGERLQYRYMISRKLAWVAGEIARVATSTIKVRGKVYGAGWVYFEMDDGDKDWVHLRPSFHGTARAGSWRLEVGECDDEE